MPSYRYTPEFSCIYTDRALEVNPGDVVEWDEAPADGRWEPVDGEEPDTSDTESSETEQADEQATAEPQPKKITRRAAPAQTPEE